MGKLKINKTLYWIIKNSKSCVILIILVSILNIVLSASYVLPAIVSKNLINIATSGGEFDLVKKGMLEQGIILLLVIIGQLILAVLNSRLSAVISGRLETTLRKSFFQNIARKKFESISKIHSGEILNRFTSDIDIVVSGITGFVPNALSIIVKILSALLVIAIFSKGFAGIILLIGIVLLICASLVKPFYKRTHKRVQEESGKMRGFMQECTENLVVVKTFSGKGALLEKLSSYMQKIYKIKIRRNTISNIAGGGTSLIFTLGYYGTMCYGCFMMALGTMDFGTLTAFLQLVSQIRAPFANASGLVTQYYSTLASAERIIELEQMENEQIDETINVKDVYDSFESINAENLTFGYNNENIIENTNLTLKKGSAVAITGLSGAGKSTFFKLLLGLYEKSGGELYLKTNKAKIPVSPFTRPLFAYVPQGNLLISGTIADNIKFANPDITNEQIHNAAKTACIYDFIVNLEDGFDTVINERGAGLSEGQIQRIAVARALCSDAPILLLDECTSALDSETEEEMLQNIKNQKTKTILFISHKNAALSICDTHIDISNKAFTLV